MDKEMDGMSIPIDRKVMEAVREAFGDEVAAVYPVTRHVESRFRRQGSFYPLVLMGETEDSVSEEQLKERIMELSEYHDALRSKIVSFGDGRPVQVVLKHPKTEFFHVDLRKLSKDGGISDAQKKYLSSLMRIDMSRHSELGEKVLFRLGLIRISDRSSVLYSGFSHYLLDGIGITVILTELFGTMSVQPDHRIWQNRIARLYGNAQGEAVAYWKKFLEDAPAFRQFPVAKNVSSGQTPSEERTHYFLSGGRKLYETLKNLAAERQLTVSILMTYAIGKALLKIQGTEEVMFYNMGNGRTIEDMLLPGMFTTSFPVRIKLGDSPEDLQRQLLVSGRYAWVYGVPEAPLRVSDDMLLLNVQNNPVSTSYRHITVPELMESSETLSDSFFGVMETELEIQAYPDQRFGFLGWCDPKRFDAAALKSLLSEALKELINYPKQTDTGTDEI